MRNADLDVRKIPGFSGYACSAEGDVFSFLSGEPRRLKPSLHKRGYLKVDLYKDRKPHTCLVHRLILQSWIGENPSAPECNHIDGDKTNNRLSNLEWVTRTENEIHARTRLGKCLQGEKHKCAKLNHDAIVSIRQLRKEGMSLPKLAKMFGVGTSTVHRIVRGEDWAHVGGS